MSFHSIYSYTDTGVWQHFIADMTDNATKICNYLENTDS